MRASRSPMRLPRRYLPLPGLFRGDASVPGFAYLTFMSTHNPVNKSGIYFITFTCYRWLSLMEMTKAYEEAYKFFNILNQNGHQVLGYVIMPNHIHFLLYFQNNGQSLNTVVGNGKRFLGYEIVRRLKKQNAETVLAQLQQGVSDIKKSRAHVHRLWEDTFDVKECWTEKFVLQKLNYIHANPCRGKWKLCREWYAYEHSSAAFYELGKRNNPLSRDYRDYLALV